MRAKTINITRAYIFDLDDTLIKTPAKIRVFRNGAFLKSLTPKEYNFYKYQAGDKLDFKDFIDGEMILNAKKYKIWPVLRNVSNAIKQGKSTSEIYILTARDRVVKSYIYEFLKKNGIIIDINHIITLGDSKNYDISKEKRIVLEKLSKKYNEIWMFDDNKDTIKLASSIPNVKTRLVESKVNEKFTDDSDPIHDMNIGIKKQLDEWVKQEEPYAPRYLKTDFQIFLQCIDKSKYDFVKYLISQGVNLEKDEVSVQGTPLRYAATANDIEMIKILINAGANPENANLGNYLFHDKRINQKTKNFLFNEIKKRKEQVNEKFTEDSDPIHDMGIGRKSLIKKWLDEMNIDNYTINDDFTIDANYINLGSKKLKKLPDYIQFNEINYTFTIGFNSLTSLRGCPKIVNGWFSCQGNKITSLEYAPDIVRGSFNCENNRLTEITKIPNGITHWISFQKNPGLFTKEYIYSVNKNIDRKVDIRI